VNAIEVILAAVLVAVNAFFVIAEYALVRSRRARLEVMAEDRERGAALALAQLDDINDYIKLNLGEDYSAKDFRTWNGTVLAAALVAATPEGTRTKTSRKRAIHAAVREVAEVLGNTPAVARRAYIDPRVFDRYRSGWTIKLPRDGLDLLDGTSGRGRRRLELAVLDLLADPTDSAATAKVAAAA